jgi:hypothetical protein
MLFVLILQFLYVILVYAICRPDDSYLNSYRYLMGKENWTTKILTICGPRYVSLFVNKFTFYTFSYVTDIGVLQMNGA